jgi:hypothetical protein
VFFFVLFCFFEIGSCELFAQAGFEPWFSWSLPPEYLGLQAWATGTWLKWYFYGSFSLHFQNSCQWPSVV